MFTHEVKLRVRYAETDQMGYVYYGNYATYYEVARVETFRDLGFSYKAMEDSGIMMPVLEMECKYFQPAKYDDLLTIKVTIPEFPKVRVTYLYEIQNEAGTLLNQGKTVLAFVNMETGRPTRMPEWLNELYRPYFPE